MMRMNEQRVISVKDYNQVDGRFAYDAKHKELMLGLKTLEKMTEEETLRKEIIAQFWQGDCAEKLEVSNTLPLHRVLDLAILACQSLLYFQDAYRYPTLYNPDNPIVARIGLQGDAMTVGVCTDNPAIDGDIADFSQELSNQGELLGERIQILARLIGEMGY